MVYRFRANPNLYFTVLEVYPQAGYRGVWMHIQDNQCVEAKEIVLKPLELEMGWEKFNPE